MSTDELRKDESYWSSKAFLQMYPGSYIRFFMHEGVVVQEIYCSAWPTHDGGTVIKLMWARENIDKMELEDGRMNPIFHFDVTELTFFNVDLARGRCRKAFEEYWRLKPVGA